MKTLKENQISVSITRNRMIEVFELKDVRNAVLEFNTYLDIVFNKNIDSKETNILIDKYFNKYDIFFCKTTIKEAFTKIFGDFEK